MSNRKSAVYDFRVNYAGTGVWRWESVAGKLVAGRDAEKRIGWGDGGYDHGCRIDQRLKKGGSISPIVGDFKPRAGETSDVVIRK